MIETQRAYEVSSKSISACDEMMRFIAQNLNRKKIFSLFQGRMEFGPRALGNRSIICSAEDARINKSLNKKLRKI